MGAIASLDETALSASEYLDHLAANFALMRTALEDTDGDASVPTCPEWTVADLIDHVAAVYAARLVSLRTGGRPDRDVPLSSPSGVAGLDWLDRQFRELYEKLAAAASDTPCWTFWEPDQTVGFWQRRMAQETLIHRYDAQRAAGRVERLDETLSVDGIDEHVGWMAYPLPTEGLAGQRISLSSGGHSWHVRLEPGAVLARGSTGANFEVDAEVSGSPADLLLHLWGRLDAGSDVTAIGDPGALAAFQTRCRALGS